MYTGKTLISLCRHGVNRNDEVWDFGTILTMIWKVHTKLLEPLKFYLPKQQQLVMQIKKSWDREVLL